LEIASMPAECGIKVHNSRGVEPWIQEEMAEAWRLPMPRIVVGRHLVGLMREAGSTDPIYVAHNGVDRTAYYPALPENLRQGVGAVYHGAEVKDPELLVRTFERLHERHPGLPLYAFGSYPKPRGLPSAVQYARLPKLPKAREIYSRSLVWFLTSRNEGLPNPLLEALACGSAVVSTDCGGAGDIIQHEHDGLLVPCGEVEPLVSSIERLLGAASLRGRFRANAEQTLNEFTWPRAVESFERALLEIVRRECAVGALPPGREVLVA
jgi:glycosyltransferase involved in cell wall biosynthesis